jgi:hypothetical protein
MTIVEAARGERITRRRRLSTRCLGAAFLAAGWTPAAMSLVQPTVARATFLESNYWDGCLGIGGAKGGPHRKPTMMQNLAGAHYTCAGSRSGGWLSVEVYKLFPGGGDTGIAHGVGDSYVTAGPVYPYKAYSVFDSCIHIGAHHSHIVQCSSARSF